MTSKNIEIEELIRPQPTPKSTQRIIKYIKNEFESKIINGKVKYPKINKKVKIKVQIKPRVRNGFLPKSSNLNFINDKTVIIWIIKFIEVSKDVWK